MSAHSRAVVKAPCKLNLHLDVLGRRADGYHDIVSVMQAVSLYNMVTIAPADGFSLSCNLPELPCDARNTAYRAAARYAEATGLPMNYHIALEKHVPYKAGLGSASADAAGVLCGLNALFDAPLTEEELLTIGLEVGADVPFLLTGGTALAEGIGERLTPLAPFSDVSFYVLKGADGFATPEIYGRYDREAPPAIAPVGAMLNALASGNPQQVAQQLHNRLEFCLPDDREVGHYKAWLLAKGALGATMTGSGSAVFGLFNPAPQKAHDWKSCFDRSLVGGSNPSFCAICRPVSHGPVVTLL